MAGYAYQDPQFQPAMRIISAITNARTPTVTTTFDHDYQDGIIVRFYVPDYYGMKQLDKQTASITVTGSDTFTVNIDTSNYDAFAVPVAQWWHSQTAMVVPVGQDNDQISQAVRDVT